MRKSIVVFLTAAALSLPSTEALAGARSTSAVAARKRVSTITKSFTGSPGSAGRYGEVEITIVIEKTTTTIGKKKTVKRRMVAIRIPVYPNHTFRSVRISQQALPILTQEALHAQSAKVDILSGATYTSQGFVGSLSDALTRARGW